MKTYSIKVALRGISPMIWRRLEINGNTTLADLHHIIQIAMNWDNTFLHKFRIYAKDYGICYSYGFSFSDDAHEVTFDQFEFEVGDKFTYEYNFFEFRLCDIRIEKIDLYESLNHQTTCIGGSRVYPDYPARHEFDVLVDMAKLVKQLLKKVTEPRLAKAVELSEEYAALKFNKQSVNQLIVEYYEDTSYR